MRKLFTLASVLSLLLCAGVVTLWVRNDNFAPPDGSYLWRWSRGRYVVGCRRGALFVTSQPSTWVSVATEGTPLSLRPSDNRPVNPGFFERQLLPGVIITECYLPEPERKGRTPNRPAARDIRVRCGWALAAFLVLPTGWALRQRQRRDAVGYCGT